MKPSRDIGRLLEIMAALRTPGTGCPWDLEQNFSTIAPYTLEEAYEVADAIARGDLATCATNWAISCSRSCSMPAWRRSKARSISAAWSRRSPKSSSAAIRMCSARRAGPAAEEVEGPWDRIKAEEKAETRGRQRPASGGHRRARRRAGGAARPHPRAEAAGQGRQGRLRLERPDGGARLKSARNATRSKPRLRPASATRRRPRSAICCSPWSIWPAIWTPIRRRRCAQPTRNSRGASPRSSRRWPRKASGRRIRRSPRWTRSGTQRRPPRPSSRLERGVFGCELTFAQAKLGYFHATSCRCLGEELAPWSRHTAGPIRPRRRNSMQRKLRLHGLGPGRIDPAPSSPSCRRRRETSPSPRCGDAASSCRHRRPGRRTRSSTTRRSASRAWIALTSSSVPCPVSADTSTGR